MPASPTNHRDERSAGAAFVPVLLFVSGAVALVYEIVWQRQFALIFGSAAPATAAVLAAYFAGLGVGALVIGRVARRWSRPLAVYAVLELLVGVGALLVAPLLGGFEIAYPWLVDALGGHPAGFMAARTGAAFLALGIPTFCMGGSLPVLGALVDRSHQQLGLKVGWLYVVNTIGAGLGALTVPFFLMPRMGLSGAVLLCATLNGVLAVAAWALDRRSKGAVDVKPSPAASVKAKSSGVGSVGLTGSPVLLLAMISGVATFALQVLWNRAFAQVHENSMYSFSVIVAVVIFALAIGGQLARVGLRRGIQPSRLIGGAWILAGVAVVIGPWLFIVLSNGLSYLPAGSGWLGDGLRLVRLAAAVLLVPVALLGIGLPAIMEQAGRSPSESTSQLLGRLLAANVLGSVAGALCAGFILPDWLGLWGGIIWLGGLVLAAGVWQWKQKAGSLVQRRTGYGLLAVWLLSSMIAALVDLPRVRLASARGETLLSLEEGAHGITAVVEREGSRRMKLNNFYGLGGTKATADERMQAHLPLILHPDPKRVAFLGMGTGITAGGALFHPIGQVTVIELVPEVVTAARRFFRDANNGMLEDPRVQVVNDDARHYLRGSGERFDLIVGDLVVPWRQGEGSLFTLEQFEAARAALNPGGIFCQWLPLFQLSEVEVNILIRTFLNVFPSAEIWRGDFSPNEPAIALVSRPANFAIDPIVIRHRLAEMRSDPANPQLGVSGIFWMHRVGLLQLDDLPGTELRLNREDRPWIELLGPMLHAGGNQQQLFTGRRLQRWTEQVRRTTEAKSAKLPDAESAGVRAGEIFVDLVQCLAEGNNAGAEAAQQRLQRTLPAEAYRQLLGR